MRKIKSFFGITAWLVAMMLLALACSDDLDIKQDYGYRIETLPLPKAIGRGETVELEFSIVRDGYYAETKYRFRFFISEGKGALGYKGKAVPVNRFQEIDSDDFTLTYQSLCDEQQQLDFVFEDSFGKRMEYTIEFSNKRAEKETETSRGG